MALVINYLIKKFPVVPKFVKFVFKTITLEALIISFGMVFQYSIILTQKENFLIFFFDDNMNSFLSFPLVLVFDDSCNFGIAS